MKRGDEKLNEKSTMGEQYNNTQTSEKKISLKFSISKATVKYTYKT